MIWSVNHFFIVSALVGVLSIACLQSEVEDPVTFTEYKAWLDSGLEFIRDCEEAMLMKVGKMEMVLVRNPNALWYFDITENVACFRLAAKKLRSIKQVPNEAKIIHAKVLSLAALYDKRTTLFVEAFANRDFEKFFLAGRDYTEAYTRKLEEIFNTIRGANGG